MKSILIVDDTKSYITILNSLLQGLYQTRIATSGQKALQIAQSDNPPDLILLDILMPDMDGYETCRQLKQNPRTNTIPVLFLTSKNEEHDEATGFDVGAVDYITKPFSPTVVLARIKTQLELIDAIKQLQEINAQLQKSVELREQVERITQHDLKNPLNALISCPEYIMETEPNLSEETQEILISCRNSAYQMLDMINRSLDLYKMEVGTYQLQAEEFDLVAILRQVLHEASIPFAPGNERYPIKFFSRNLEAGDALWVLGESLLSYSMFSNLVRNALEASPKDVPIVIQLGTDEQDRQCVINIINHGSVPINIRERFFEKLVTAGKRHGTGLGTYSARLCAETQNGSILLDSSTEGKTRIELRLPLADGETGVD